MRIVTLFSTSMSGGAAKSWLTSLTYLKEQGVKILAITPNEGYVTEELKTIGIPYECVYYLFSAYPRLINLRSTVKAPYTLFKTLKLRKKAILQITKICKEFNPDLIHSNASVIDEGYIVAEKMRIPHVWHLREFGNLDFSYHFFPIPRLYRKHISKDSYSIAITECIATHFQLTDKFEIIYNAVNDGTLSPIDYNKEDYFLYMGMLTKRKGVTELIKAYKEYRTQGGLKRLILLGYYEPTYKAKMEKILGNYSDEVEFMGNVKDVKPFLQKAAALIVSSRMEAFGRITAEAMTMGCLVIGKNTGGTKEQLDLGLKLKGCELGLRYNTKKDLTECLNSIDRISLEEFKNKVDKAQSLVCELYSTQKNGQTIISFFKNVIESYHKTQI